MKFILEDYLREEEISEIFKGKIPKDLKIKVTKAPAAEEQKKEESKPKVNDSQSIANVTANITDKKDESGTNLISDNSDEDTRNNAVDKSTSKKVYTEAELDQKVYITLSETDTNIIYFAPSTKILSNKVRK